jgi:membrane protease YdiL (CAAX protease family)
MVPFRSGKGVPAMSLVWNPLFLEPVVSLGSAVVLYLLYHYHFTAPLAERMQRVFAPGRPVMVGVLAHRFCGMVTLGVVPLVVVTAILRGSAADYGISKVGFPLSYLVAGVLCLLLFPVLLAYTRGSTDGEKKEPVFPRPVFGDVALNALSWVLYLCAYEFFVRGFILFPLARAMGVWPAVAAITLIYTAIHLDRPRGEAAGCLIMGLLFGILTLWSKSILPALIVHVFIANTTDVLVLARQRPGRNG